VNGDAREMPEGSTVRDLLIALELGAVLVAVERNQAIIPRTLHATTELADGDTLEIVHFVGGG
jgi:thiamine biosynthesis protein ThiS